MQKVVGAIGALKSQLMQGDDVCWGFDGARRGNLKLFRSLR